MKRLADGVYAIVEEAPAESALERLDEGVVYEVEAAHAEELAALAHGVADDEADTPLLRELEREGLVTREQPGTDPVIEARLSDLGRGLSWTLQGDERGPALAELLRRGHARRKVFVQAFGQTPCLPEAAARRCLTLTQHKPPGARVMLLGDDDLLGLGLAQLGYDVTSVDIDPLLVSFLARAAEAEGLALETRVLDLLAPLGADDVGAFDAVLTDPMSFDNCMLAFDTRALALVKGDGVVLTCVHPVGRDAFRRVLPRLPARVLDVHTRLSAYYFDRYIENAYRSDLVVLARAEGELAFASDETIPFSAITEGRLAEHEHALVSLKGMRSKSKPVPEPAALASAFARACGLSIAHAGGSRDDRWVYGYAARAGGGHVAITFDTLRGAVELCVYPGLRSEVEPGLDAQDLVRVMKQDGWFVSAFGVPPRLL